MGDQTYLVTLKPPSQATQHVVASIVGVHGDHLVFEDTGYGGQTSRIVSLRPSRELGRASAQHFEFAANMIAGDPCLIIQSTG
jgi:hypothetical protein